MRPHLFHPIVPAIFAVAVMGTSAFGQMTLISAERVVYAAGGQTNNPPDSVQMQSSTDFGSWGGSVNATLAYASQTSTITTNGVTVTHLGSAAVGGGHWGDGHSTLDLTFEVQSAVAWEFSAVFTGSGISRSLVRERDNQELFSDLYARPSPLLGSGFLDAGRYHLRLGAWGGLNSDSNETATFSITVPAPSSFAMLLAAPIAFRRRRS